LAASPEITESAPRAIDEILGLSSQPTYPEHVYSNEDDAQHGPLAHMDIEGIFPTAIGQAIIPGVDEDTIDRNSSMSFTNTPSDLDDVPEEEEPIHWRESLVSKVAEETTSRAQSQLSPPPESEATVASPKSKNLSIYVTEKLSKKVSEALGSPTLPQYRQPAVPPHDQKLAGMIKRTASVRRKATYETIYESWDADIDYCYEHAAESNCDFDWARNSFDESPREEFGVPTMASDLGPSDEGDKNHLLPAVHLSTSTLPTLDLEPSPSRSLPSAQVELTPSTVSYEGDVEISQQDSDYFPVSSSMFPSALGKHLTQDTLYEEYLAADAESDRHFSFCSQGVIQPMEQPVSPRSSFSPISKCNSEESLILSRAASIVRKHRSSVSTTSVPELVHSLANSRELPAMDQATSGEHTLPFGLGLPESSSYHRQTKSLAREIETQSFFRADGGAGLISAGLALTASPSIHDRAKSTSEVEASSLVAKTTKTDAPVRGAHRRKGRTSYSLFPTPAASNNML
jgi:RNA polymerase-associated protein CTR9